MNKFRIAILGTRGIPANYGGFEYFAEELSLRLVKKGYDVTVFCRKSHNNVNDNNYGGVILKRHFVLNGKYLDTFSHAVIANIIASLSNYDILLICGVGTGSFSFIPKIFGKKIIVNVDGVEWKRNKYSKLASLAVIICVHLVNYLADIIVFDSKIIQNKWKELFNKDGIYISYGGYDGIIIDTNILNKLNLKRKEYILYVGRLEPENNADIVVNEYSKIDTNYPLVIVGDAPHAKKYILSLKKDNNRNIIFPGYIFGNEYIDLLRNAYLYVHANQTGGTNPGLLNAMALGNCVLALDVSYNLEVIGDSAIAFKKDSNDLSKKMKYLITNPHIVEKYRQAAYERVREIYSWDKVTNAYEDLFKKILIDNNL